MFSLAIILKINSWRNNFNLFRNNFRIFPFILTSLPPPPHLNVSTLLANSRWWAVISWPTFVGSVLDARLNVPTLLANICWISVVRVAKRSNIVGQHLLDGSVGRPAKRPNIVGKHLLHGSVGRAAKRSNIR